MAVAISISSSLFPPHLLILDSQTTPRAPLSKPPRLLPSLASHRTQIALDRPALSVAEAVSEAELRAAARLRVRSFYDFDARTYAVEVSRTQVVICSFRPEFLNDLVFLDSSWCVHFYLNLNLDFGTESFLLSLSLYFLLLFFIFGEILEIFFWDAL